MELTERQIKNKIVEIIGITYLNKLIIASFLQYETVDIYDLENINTLLTEGLNNNIMPTLHGSELKKSQRYILFTEQKQECHTCGLKASFWALQKDSNNESKRYHLNLYGVSNEGEVILFTKDHIIPKSLGGKDKADNYQSMCSCCNAEKSNDIKDNPNFDVYSFNSVDFYKNKLNGKTYIISKKEQNKKIIIDTADLEKFIATEKEIKLWNL